MVAECSRVFLSISCNQSMSNLPDDLASRLDTTSTIAFALMLIIIFFGLIGNLLIVYIVCTKPKMITVHNVHVVNLAVIDIVFLCVCSVVDVIGMGVIAFQDGLLSISHSHSAGIMFVQTLTFTAACGTLIALAFQRYLAIVRPLENKKRRTVKNANILQTLVWTVSIAMGVTVAALESDSASHVIAEGFSLYQATFFFSLLGCAVNSALNPVIYGMLTPDFHRHLVQIIFHPFAASKPQRRGTMEGTRRESVIVTSSSVNTICST
eukprot:XP_003725870.1 PREDICTED: kiSS-1 receptor [Strongylocentrotus purpuratus]